MASSSSASGYQLLQQGEPSEPPTTRTAQDLKMGKSLGTFRACYVVSLCCIGSFLFAYDTGIVGGVLTLPSFQNDFGYTKADKTQVNSNCVSILQGGAFFGCFFIWPLTAWLGRRWAFVISSVVFCVGCIMQIVNSHSLGLFYAGRVISGLGTGAATVLVPIFSAEMAPKEIRGKLGSCFQLFFATGVCISYWVDYAAQKGISETSSTQWQVPIGLQLVPGGLLGLGMLLVKESTRWLAKRGRNEEAYASLLWVRGGVDSSEIRAEFQEILAGVELEIRESEGVTWKELLLPSNRYRMFIAITIQLAQQLTGNTSLAYYAPQIFATIGAGNKTLFITGFFGLVKMAGVALFITFFVERYGRKLPFMVGAFAMGSFMLIIALIVATHPPKPSATGITSSGAAGIAMVYLEAFSFNMSWGPLPWLYIGEIFPNRIREIGVATGAASQWLFNFVMSQITPHAIANIGWRTFLMFAIFNYAIIVYSYFVLKETTGKSLEEMEVVFGTVDHLPTKDDDEVESQAGQEGAREIHESTK
jgi:sugar porter (SP) family MFS transporter